MLKEQFRKIIHARKRTYASGKGKLNGQPGKSSG